MENTPAATSQLSSNLKAFHVLLHYSQLYVRAPWVRVPGGAPSQATSEIAIRIKVGRRRKWYEALLCAFTNLGFRASTADLGAFLTKVDKHILILAIHVELQLAGTHCRVHPYQPKTGPVVPGHQDHPRPLSSHTLPPPLPDFLHRLYPHLIRAG